MNINITDLFDNYSYVITICEERYKRFNKIMSYYGFNHIQKHIGRLDNNNPVTNCTNSHYDIIRYAIKNHFPYLLIFEDDAVPTFDKEKLIEKLKYYLTDIPDQCNGLQLGWCLPEFDEYQKFNRKPIKQHDPLFIKTQKYISNIYYDHTKYGYMRTGSHALLLCNNYDVTMHRQYADDYRNCDNFYCIGENLFGQSNTLIETCDKFITGTSEQSISLCKNTIDNLIEKKVI